MEFEILLTWWLGARHGCAINRDIHAREDGSDPIEDGYTVLRAAAA